MPTSVIYLSRIRAGFFFLFFAAALTAPAWGQKDAGAIVGLVRDASGAVVAEPRSRDRRGSRHDT